MTVVRPEVEHFIAAGLYDPASPEAEKRLALLQFLAASGASIEEMLAADARGRLFALGGDRIIRPGRDQFTLDEVAMQLNASPADVRAVWRALGLVEAASSQPVASATDVETLRTVLDISVFIGMPTALGVCRVVASSLARVSDAISTAVRTAVPNLALENSDSELATAQTFAGIAPLVPRTGATLDAVFRHHLEVARMQFEQTDSGDVAGDGGIRVGVGFADLSGFTGLTQSMSMAELSMMLTGFEELADEIVRAGGGRVVKYIGDAVMFIATDGTAVAHIAERLLDTAEAHGLRARAGVTHGVTLALAGDYFGPVVNLAARLVAMAGSGEILVTTDVAEQLPDSSLIPLGPRQVRGFTEPVELLRLR